MRSSLCLATLAVVAGVSALPQQMGPNSTPAPPLSPEFIASAPKFTPVNPEEATERFRNPKNTTHPPSNDPNSFTSEATATCTNLRIRTEWDVYSDNDRLSFVNAIKCLMNKPATPASPQLAKTRYEDLILVHQNLNVNIHGTHKFLIWHRYFVWVFEDMLRQECGFTANMPWWDETKWAGRFQDSSVFSNNWFGSVDLHGACVNDGKFGGLQLHLGGPNNDPFCLTRDLNNDASQYTSASWVGTCTDQTGYTDMATCVEGVPHNSGHNAVGGLMNLVALSPSDPVFWLHHLFVDHNYRIWQTHALPARNNEISGTDHAGNPLTLDTIVDVAGLRSSVRIRDILDTTGSALCYKYDR